MLGVNSDKDREQLKKALVKENITWQSWWDEGSIDGPIHKQWQIIKRPGIHLIDAKGVIRYKDIEPDQVDKAVDELLADLASGGKK